MEPSTYLKDTRGTLTGGMDAPRPALDAAISELDHELAVLAEAVEQLGRQLDPVRVPQNVTMAKEGPVPGTPNVGPVGPVVSRLMGMTRLAERVIREVRGIRDTLEV